MKASYEMEDNAIRLYCSCGGCCTAVTLSIEELMVALCRYVLKTNYTQPFVAEKGSTSIVLMPSFAKKIFRELQNYYEKSAENN